MAPEAYRTDPATWTCAGLKNLRPTFGETVVVALAFIAPFGEVSMALWWGAGSPRPPRRFCSLRRARAPARMSGCASAIEIGVCHLPNLLAWSLVVRADAFIVARFDEAGSSPVRWHGAEIIAGTWHEAREYGKWQMANGNIANGKWQMAISERQMATGGNESNVS